MPPVPDVFLPLCVVVALAGLVRGFTGFGSTLAVIPLASGIVAPWQAVILLFVVDGFALLPLLPGTQILLAVARPRRDGRWQPALGAVAVLASGSRHRSPPRPSPSAAVGASSGVLGGKRGF